MKILRSDFPGYTIAEELTDRTIRNRYLVLRLIIHDAPVYIHNVFAPVKAEERVGFMSYCFQTLSNRPQHISYLVISTHHSIQLSMLRVEQFDTNQVD